MELVKSSGDLCMYVVVGIWLNQSKGNERKMFYKSGLNDQRI